MPKPEGEPEPEAPAEQAAGPSPLEDMNVDQLLSQPENRAPAPLPIAAMPPEVAPPPPAPPEPPRRVGMFLSLSMIFVSVGVVVLLLILMFVLGLIIGRATMIPPDNKVADSRQATGMRCSESQG